MSALAVEFADISRELTNQAYAHDFDGCVASLRSISESLEQALLVMQARQEDAPHGRFLS
jgi:hypothetical protein